MTLNLSLLLEMENEGFVAKAKVSKAEIDQFVTGLNALGGASDTTKKKTDDLGDSFRKSGDDTKEQAAQIQRLTALYNPLQAAQERYNHALDELKTAQDLGIVNSRQYGEQLSRLNQTYSETVRELNGVAAAERQTAQANRELQTSAQRIKDSIDPLLPVQRAYAASLREIKAAAAAQLLTEDQVATAMVRSKAIYQQQSKEAQRLAKSMGMATANYRQGGAAAQQAGYQIGDFAVQVASGQSAVVAFTQQMSQLLGFFGPIGAVAGAVAAILGGLYLAFGQVTDGSEEAAEGLDKYRQSLEAALKASRDTEADTGSLPDRLKNNAITEIEEALALEDALIKDLNEKIREQSTKRAVFQEALDGGASGLGADAARKGIEQLDARIAGLSTQFDGSTDRIEAMNAQLAILRDSLGEVTDEIKEKTSATEELNERLDHAQKGLLAVTGGGIEGAAAFDQLSAAEDLAAKSAEQYNKENERLIELGQLQKKTQDDYLDTAKQVIAAETRASEIKKDLVAAGKEEEQQRKASLKSIEDEFQAYDKLLTQTDDLVASKKDEADRVNALTAALKISQREYLVVAQTQAIMATGSALNAEQARALAEAVVDANLALGELQGHQGALKGLVEEFQTPLESYLVRMRELEELRPFAKAPAEIEAIERAMKSANEELRQAQIEADGFSSALQDAAGQILGNFQNLWDDIFEDGLDSVDDFADSVLAIFVRLAGQLATTFILGDILGLTGGLGVFDGTFASGLSSLISPTSVLGGALGLGGAGAGGISLGGGGTSLIGAAQPFTSAASFASQMFTGGAAAPLVFSQAGAGLGLSSATAIPGAANGAIAAGAGTALEATAIGTALLEMTSLAVLPFIGMGIAALGSILLKEDGPRSAAQVNAQNGRFGVEAAYGDNGASEEIGQAFGDAASELGNAFLESAGLSLSPDAVLGMIGLDEKVIRTTTGSGIYNYDTPGVLGIQGITKDGRTFENSEDGQRAAIADFVSRNLLDQLLSRTLDGLAEDAANTLKLGLGNLTRELEGSLDEQGFEDFTRRLGILANFDDMVAALDGVDAVAEDAARRLDIAADSQRAFNDQITAYSSETAAAIEETGTGIASLKTFLSDAEFLFSSTGSARTQIRLNLADANEGSIDGRGIVSTSGGEGGNETLTGPFGRTTVKTGEGSGDLDPSVITVFGEEIALIDKTLGEGGQLITAFKDFNDGMQFNMTELTDVLEKAGVEVPLVLDEFFKVDDRRDRMHEAAEVLKSEVDGYFTNLLETGVSGPIQLFEEIVPPLTDITKGFLDVQTQIESTRPDLEELNAELKRFGEEVIDIDGTLKDAKDQNATNAQDQFLASLGIAVGEDGTVQSAAVDFGSINSLAETVKTLDENARVLFETDPRGLLPEVESEIDGILRDGLQQILNSAEDYGTTLEQIEKIFGDRVDSLNLVEGGSTGAALDFNAEVNRQLLGTSDPKTLQLLDLIEKQRAERDRAEVLGADTSLLEKLHQQQVDSLLGLTDAVNDNTEAQQDEVDRLKDLTSSLSRVIPRLEDFDNSLALDPELSILTALERYDLAKSRYEEARDAAVIDGDLSAVEALPDLARDFIEVSREVNAANDNYRADYLDVRATNAEVKSLAVSQLEVAEKQLAELVEIKGGLSGAFDNLTSGQDLGHNPALNALLASASGYGGDFGDGGFQAAANAYVSSAGIDLGQNAGINSVLAYITKFGGDFGDNRFQNHAAGLSGVQLEAARAFLLANGMTPGFFTGGLVMNGSETTDSVFAPMLAGNEFVFQNAAVAQIGVPTLDYMNRTGNVPGGDFGPAANLIVNAIHSEGDATRRQMRDESEYQAGYMDGVRAAIEERAEDAHRSAQVTAGRVAA